MKLHWSPKSPYVRKVMVCAHELGVIDRLELHRSVAAMLRPNAELMRDNPLSKIPALVLDDGTVLPDSVVICEYLNGMVRGPLFPQASNEKWPALRWHAIGDGLLDVSILWRNERERSDEKRLDPLMSAFDLKVRATLDLLETEVEKLRCAPFTIGTLTLGCAMGYLDYRFHDLDWRAGRPGLADWTHTLFRRPSFLATEPTDG